MTDMLPDDDDEIEFCPVCGCELDWEECDACGGGGGEYPHDIDPLGYDPDEFLPCDICGGAGGWSECPMAAHHPIVPGVKP